jgi:hypothetical protein
MADPVAAYLARAKARYADDEIVMGEHGTPVPAALEDVPRLLAAVEAVLAVHQAGRFVVLGSLCAHHESHRFFSITSTEAASVRACQNCTATVYCSCAGCGPQVGLDLCPVRQAITRALLGREAIDA